MPKQAARVARDIITSAVMVGFAVTEIVFGRAMMNPAVIADAGHSAIDGISTVVSAVMKWITGNHPSHWVQVHIPAKFGIWICWATIIGIGGATLFQLRSPSEVTAKSAITAVVLGGVGAGVRYWLSRVMERGEEPTDKANAGHLRTDAWVSVFLSICGCVVLGINYLVPSLGPWVFRGGALWILYKAYKANRHIIDDIKSELEECRGCEPNKETQLDE